MMRGLAIAMLLIGAGSIPAFADVGARSDAGITKIVLTFSDVGMINATRAGPPGP